jgi:hypothetical protein
VATTSQQVAPGPTGSPALGALDLGWRGRLGRIETIPAHAAAGERYHGADAVLDSERG